MSRWAVTSNSSPRWAIRASGCAIRLADQAGWAAWPKLEATTTNSPSSITAASGVVRGCPDLAPVAVSMIMGSMPVEAM